MHIATDVPWPGLGDAVTSRVTGSLERYATAPADAQQAAARTTTSNAMTSSEANSTARSYPVRPQHATARTHLVRFVFAPIHFEHKLVLGLGYGGHQTDARLVRVGAAWQAATYLPPAHINAHERAAPPVIRTSKGRRPSLSGNHGPVVVHTAPRHPATSSKPDSAEP